MWPRNNLDHEDGADYFWSLYRHWIINVWPRNGSRGMYSPRKVYFYREPLEERQTGVPGTCTIFIYNPCRMNFTICRRKRPREREREREREWNVFSSRLHTGSINRNPQNRPRNPPVLLLLLFLRRRYYGFRSEWLPLACQILYRPFGIFAKLSIKMRETRTILQSQYGALGVWNVSHTYFYREFILFFFFLSLIYMSPFGVILIHGIWKRKIALWNIFVGRTVTFQVSLFLTIFWRIWVWIKIVRSCWYILSRIYFSFLFFLIYFLLFGMILIHEI